MGVKRESVDNPFQNGTATIVKVERAASGYWLVSLRVEMAAHLTDGRRIILNRTMMVRATQQLGRKPVDGPQRKSKP